MCTGETFHETVVSCALGVLQQSVKRPAAPDIAVGAMHDAINICAQVHQFLLNVLQYVIFQPRTCLVVFMPNDLRTFGLLDCFMHDVLIWRVTALYVIMPWKDSGSPCAEASKSSCASLYAVPNRKGMGRSRHRERSSTLW